MKSYLNFEGLSRFLDNLMGLFVRTNDIISIYEIDEICDSTNYENIFISNNTDGSVYNVYVDNGSLKMAKVDDIASEEQLSSDVFLIDEVTGVIYKLYIDNDKLGMESVNDASYAVNDIVFVDDVAGTTYRLFVSNGELSMMEVG